MRLLPGRTCAHEPTSFCANVCKTRNSASSNKFIDGPCMSVNSRSARQHSAKLLASAPPPGELRRELGRGALAIVSLRDGEAVKAVPKALLIALRCTQDALREQSALQAACTGSDVPHVLPRLLGTAQDARCIYFRLEAVLCEGASVQLDQVLRAQTGNQLPPASAKGPWRGLCSAHRP